MWRALLLHLLLLLLMPYDGVEGSSQPFEGAGAGPMPGQPSGALLWSNVSEAGNGEDFSSAQLLPCGDVLLMVPHCSVAGCDMMRLSRLQPSTGKLVWSVSPPTGPWSLALGGSESTPVAILSQGLSYSSSSITSTVRAYDANIGKFMWAQNLLPFHEPVPLAVSSSKLLVAGAASVRGVELGVRAIVLSLTDGTVLLNRTVAQDNTTYSVCSTYGDKVDCQRQGCGWNANLGQCDRIDWFPRSAALIADSPALVAEHSFAAAGSGEVALIGTDDAESGVAAGMIVAVDLTDRRIRWAAHNVSAARLYIVEEASVLVAAVDTRPFFGRKSKVLMLRGFALTDGRLLWQRTATVVPTPDHAEVDGPASGIALARACNVDCSLPCQPGLVAAGTAFGAIDAETGRTIYTLNTTSAGIMPPHAVANGVAYHIQQAQAIKRFSTVGRGATTLRSGPGTLVALACSSGKVLWSALLPLGEDGGAAPFYKIIVSPVATIPTTYSAVAAAATMGSATVPRAASAVASEPVVLVGGHEQGQCFRGHCAPSYSAIAAFRGPSAHGPPIPPAPPAPPPRCEEKMRTACAIARASSIAKCDVCCGEHAKDLQKAGCVEHDFEVFCTSRHHVYTGMNK